MQAYIAAMPGWKHDIGERIDELVTQTLPDVRKAVRWNTPFYGLEDQGWFLSYHCFDRYVKVTWHNGGSLEPAPPVTSKYPQVRYFHVHEDDEVDERQFVSWIEQASKLPGDRLF